MSDEYPNEDVWNDNHTLITSTYYSLDDFADAAMRRYVDRPDKKAYMETDSLHHGGTIKRAAELAHSGWTDQLDAAVELSESAVETVEKTLDVKRYFPVWDVTGSMVDVPAYLAGDPECMMDVPPVEVRETGRVITLCASRCYSAAIEEWEIIDRGQVITALALALSRVGYNTELWTDITHNGKARTRVMVKGANDELDPAKVMFAYAHPAFQRRLEFGHQHGLPKTVQRSIHTGTGYGRVTDAIHDMPEGTLYLPSLLWGGSAEPPAEKLAGYLRDLGLVNED